jgi:phage gp36-like protein
MKKLFFMLLVALTIGSGAGLFATAQTNKEAGMAYCTIDDLYNAYGEDYIAAWSARDPDMADRAIVNAGAEIDGYLLSGGYTVPLAGTPDNIRKYCIDIACANLVISSGVLDSDPGGQAVIDQAKIARAYLTKVAEGKFKIPGYSSQGGDAVSKPPSGNIQARSMRKLDMRGYC